MLVLFKCMYLIEYHYKIKINVPNGKMFLVVFVPNGKMFLVVFVPNGKMLLVVGLLISGNLAIFAA